MISDSTDSIFLIGGSEGHYLNPKVIYMKEGEAIGFEHCQTEKYKGRSYAFASRILSGKYVVCGGHKYYEANSNFEKECEIYGGSSKNTFNMLSKGRREGSAIKLNHTTMWVTGGKDIDSNELNTSEFITVNGSVGGKDLPILVNAHCMVEYAQNKVLLIGGSQGDPDHLTNFFSKTPDTSKKTWIIDIDLGFKMTEGPPLNDAREDHLCGVVKDEFGNAIIVVAGGFQAANSVELLNTTLMDQWTQGTL